MLCQNCGKNEVNFRYTQVINGEKREIALCDKCAKKLGLESLDFSREIEDLFNMSFAESFLPSFARTNMLGSRNLGTIFNNDIFSNPFFGEVSQEPEQIETTSGLSDAEKQDVLKDIENATKKNKQENQKQPSRKRKLKNGKDLLPTLPGVRSLPTFTGQVYRLTKL